MIMKSVLIPLAAFAVTVTGASAFSTDMLKEAGLSDDQISAFEQAKELRESGDKDAARDVLVAANIDESTMEKIRIAMKESHHDNRMAIHTAVEANDYPAFLVAIAGSPLAEIINTEAEFQSFVRAHTLIQSGNKDEAKDILRELGINDMGHKGMKFHGDKEPHFMTQLSDEQKAEVKVAMKDRDHDKVHEILTEAGVDLDFEINEHRRGLGLGKMLKTHD